MMKTRILNFIILAVSILTVFSCAENLETAVTPVGQNRQGDTYTMTIVAGKGEADTKALSLDGSTLNATWAQGDVVTVYKGETEVGTLTARSSGPSTTLQGSLNDTITVVVDDEFTLKFLSPDYTTQDGTLTGNDGSIDKVCDFATATVRVTSVSDGQISATSANFVNQQAIVEFTLMESDGSEITEGVNSLVVTAGGMEITVTPASDTDVLYVAIPAIDYGVSIRTSAQTEWTV